MTSFIELFIDGASFIFVLFNPGILSNSLRLGLNSTLNSLYYWTDFYQGNFWNNEISQTGGYNQKKETVKGFHEEDHM